MNKSKQLTKRQKEIQVIRSIKNVVLKELTSMALKDIKTSINNLHNDSWLLEENNEYIKNKIKNKILKGYE